MTIQFTTASAGNIQMFNEPALKLIELMGRRPQPEGAIEADDVVAALSKLQVSMEGPIGDEVDQSADTSDDWDDEPPVTLRQRAKPLLDLLQSAVDEGVPVLWRPG